MEQVRAVEEGREIPAVAGRAKREVTNYFAGLRFIENSADKQVINHEDVFTLHRILAAEVMDQGTAGRYCTIAVRVGGYVPPPPGDVSGLMFELLTWWNQESAKLSPVLSSAILHYRFEAIHPFADGNGRSGRALALWELYRRGFDTYIFFPWMNFIGWTDGAITGNWMLCASGAKTCRAGWNMPPRGCWPPWNRSGPVCKSFRRSR